MTDDRAGAGHRAGAERDEAHEDRGVCPPPRGNCRPNDGPRRVSTAMHQQALAFAPGECCCGADWRRRILARWSARCGFGGGSKPELAWLQPLVEWGRAGSNVDDREAVERVHAAAMSAGPVP